MRKHAIKLVLLLTLTTLSACFQGDNTSVANKEKRTTPNTSNRDQTFKLTTVDDLYQFLTYDENRYPLVSAHRGGPIDGYPENAIETFAFTASKMPAIIECDIRLSKDSVMILMHDQTLDRTTTGSGKVNDYTLAELKKLRLKDINGNTTSYQIPTLEEALIWGNGKVIYTLDVKQDVPYKLLSNTIENLKAQPYVVVITYSANQAKALHNINPDLMISASIQTEKDFRRLVQLGIPDNRIVAFVGTRQPNQSLVKILHQHGIKTILGTIGNLDRQADKRGYQIYAELVEKGADILSTDRPFEAHKALEFYMRKRNIKSPYINF